MLFCVFFSLVAELVAPAVRRLYLICVLFCVFFSLVAELVAPAVRRLYLICVLFCVFSASLLSWSLQLYGTTLHPEQTAAPTPPTEPTDSDRPGQTGHKYTAGNPAQITFNSATRHGGPIFYSLLAATLVLCRTLDLRST